MRIHDYSLKNQKPIAVDDIIRVGNQNKDGGYILSNRQIGLTKVLIGLGVHYDWSFESNFKDLNKGVVLYCYDFSVSLWIFLKGFFLSVLYILSPYAYANTLLNRRKENFIIQPFIELRAFFKFSTFFNKSKNNHFFQKGISDHKNKKFITISEMFGNIPGFADLQDDSVYIKMDIEGSEYDVLEDILVHSKKINGMVIEFHNLKQLWSEYLFLIEQIKKNFEIIHIHGNNCCGCISGTNVPLLVEVSFIKRTLLTEQELNSINNRAYPVAGLDKPNLSNKPDIAISFQ